MKKEETLSNSFSDVSIILKPKLDTDNQIKLQINITNEPRHKILIKCQQIKSSSVQKEQYKVTNWDYSKYAKLLSISKSINIFYHINKRKKAILLFDAEKAFDKTLHSFRASLVAQMVKKSACNAGDPLLVPGLGRSPGEGNGNPLQYLCLENPMDRGVWQATVRGITKSQIQQSN